MFKKKNDKLNSRLDAIKTASSAELSDLARERSMEKLPPEPEELRGAPRKEAYRVCTVALADGSVVQAVLRNISSTGAMLSGERVAGLPDKITIRIPGLAEPRKAQVMWRDESSLGVHFI